jgi:hypothetical protein
MAMEDWKLPWQGGCLCGQVRFAVAAPPMLAFACHCSACQKLTASAFSLNLSIPKAGFQVTQGETVIGGLHRDEVRHHHCDRCKSWLFTMVPALDFLVNVRAAMLDVHGWYEPYVEVWRSQGLPWAGTGAARSYEGEPEPREFEGLMAGYAVEGARPG